MTTKISEMKVGDELWWVPEGRWSNPGVVTITRIGTKYVYTTRAQLYRKNLHGVSFDSDGRAYLSKEDHEKHQEADAMWFRLVRGISHVSRPYNVTAPDIAAAAARIGIELETAP